MKAATIIDSVLNAAEGLKSSAQPAGTAAVKAVAPLAASLPTVLPFIARNVRRYPVQAALAGAALLLLATYQRRQSARRFSPYL